MDLSFYLFVVSLLPFACFRVAGVQEEAWRRVMLEELAAAERQGASKKASDGIVLVMSREGKVLRRGVGVPVWKSIRDDVDPPVKKKDK